MSGYGRIDNDLREFKLYIKTTDEKMKENPSFDAGKRIESAFEALVKGTDLTTEKGKIIQGTQLGEKEAKALYKLTKKFIDTHDVVTVSDRMLANMNAVKEKYAFGLGSKFARLENQFLDKAEIEYTAEKTDLKKQLEKEMKDHAKEVSDLRKQFKSKLIKYGVIAAGSFAGALAGLAVAISTAGLGLILFGAGMMALGLSTSIFAAYKGMNGISAKEVEYNKAADLQSARMKAFEILNDENKFTNFCKWHQVAPENVTINELMYAYQFSVRREDRPKVSEQFEELNSSYHHMLVHDSYYTDPNETIEGFMKKFEGCGLKDDQEKLHVLRYLDHSLKMEYFPDGKKNLLYFPPQEKYWRHQRLLEVQKELQPDTQDLSSKDELELLRHTDPRNAWQNYRLKTLEEEEGMLKAYKKALAEFANTPQFKDQKKRDRNDLDVNAEPYKEYACLLMEGYPFAGPYHLARLNELREKLKRG